MRDVSHMSKGAQFLGLGPEPGICMRQFAENISASKKWCTWWEITGDGKPAPVDYKSDENFGMTCRRTSTFSMPVTGNGCGRGTRLIWTTSFSIITGTPSPIM